MKFLKRLFSRFVITSIFILVQTFLAIYFFNKLAEKYIYVFFAANFLSYILLLFILNKNGSPSYKIPWILFILTLPIPGLLSYIMFAKPIITKKYRKKFIQIIEDANQKYKINKEDLKELKTLSQTAYNQSKYIYKTSLMHTSKNTKTVYFKDGESMFEEMLNKIRTAKKYIFIETFIMSPGYMLNTLVDLLEQKAKEGIEVRILYDDIGSMKHLPRKYYKTLIKKGIKCEVFNKYNPVITVVHNNRDHRKLLIVDGDFGFIGGTNIADEYINKIQPFGHWKDNGIMLQGAGVKNMTILFLEMWNVFSKNKTEEFEDYINELNSEEANGFVQVFGDGPLPLYNDHVGENTYLNFINQANKYLYITTPYLIIDYNMIHSLALAAKRGVDVKIIVPHIPDKKIISSITKSNYKVLIESGVKIYEYLPGFIHSKTILTDDDKAIVGTINLDYRSFIHHFECACWMYKPDCYNDMLQDFLDTVEKSKCIKLEDIPKHGLIKRLFVSLIKLFSPLL